MPSGGVLYENGLELAKSIDEDASKGVDSNNYWIITEFIGVTISVLFYVSETH